MNKKYQVFISSTQQDLRDERRDIMEALLKCKCIPAGMELFSPANKKSWDIIKQDIDESDFYLLIIAGKYGSETKDEHGKNISFTEKEYNYALSTGKPIMAFIHEDIGKLPASKVETSPTKRKKLEKFKNRVKNDMQVGFWTSSEKLISQITAAVQNLITDSSSAGWVKGTELNARGVDDDFVMRLQNLNEWGIEKIFKTRAEKNGESDPKLEKHNVKILDGIAFGLSSFRSDREDDVLACLQNGMNMRLLAMNPNSEFAKQRAVEEGVHPDSICKSIKDLVEWVNKLNQKSTKGKIQIKYYNAMTLDFYWRIDNDVYVGPYMYGIVSQQTVTAKFSRGGKGFKLYTGRFEKLWNDTTLCEYPLEFIKP